MAAKIGRPRAKIDIEDLEKLAALQCTVEELAAFFRVSKPTMISRLKEDEYREAWERGKEGGKASLRRHQFALAEKNAAMAIFLGKQYLDQKDVSHQRHGGEDGGPIKTESAVQFYMPSNGRD